jgi:hypothetical protein
VDSQHLQVHAAVGFATAASDAASAIEVRFDRAAVARFDVFGRTTYRNHLDANLVTEYSRVAEKRLPSIEGMDVGAADTDAVNAHRRFSGLDRCRRPLCESRARRPGSSRRIVFILSRNKDDIGFRSSAPVSAS